MLYVVSSPLLSTSWQGSRTQVILIFAYIPILHKYIHIGPCVDRFVLAIILTWLRQHCHSPQYKANQCCAVATSIICPFPRIPNLLQTNLTMSDEWDSKTVIGFKAKAPKVTRNTSDLNGMSPNSYAVSSVDPFLYNSSGMWFKRSWIAWWYSLRPFLSVGPTIRCCCWHW